MDHPSRGKIRRDGKLSWTLGLSGGFQGALSGEQNARFVFRIHGVPDQEIAERTNFVHVFSELGDYFFAPMKTYSSGMRCGLPSLYHWLSDSTPTSSTSSSPLVMRNQEKIEEGI
jgi:capsular polysaccharide transport system ATP-binding protein